MMSAWRDWCRLCARENGTGIDIFLKNENSCNIVDTLSKYFTISVSPLDEAPVTICNSCFQFLASLTKFAERVCKVEAMYSAIVFENMNSIDYSSLKYQYGIEEDCELPDVADKCDQGTDTTDLTIEYLHIPGEMYGSEHASDDLQNDNDVSCSIDKVESPVGRRLDPLVELLKIEQISGDKESVDELCIDDYLRDDDDDNDSIENPKNDDIPLEKIKRNTKRTKKLKRDCNSTGVRSSCDICGQEFKHKSSLCYHRKVHHPSVKISFGCTKCSRKFPTEKRAKEHEMIHSDPDLKLSYPCDFCEKKFSKQANLQTHIRTIHIGERPFICESCGKSFATKGALNEHKYTHMEATPFQCSSCPKKFKNLARLKTHEDIHIGTTYVCPNCGLILNTKRTLQMHMVVHSDQKKYKCNFCGNEFKRAKALKNHLILHSGLRPYTCPFCDKTFANGSNCRSHKKKAHPQELAAMEAAGETFRATNIPKLEQLKSVPVKAESSSLTTDTLPIDRGTMPSNPEMCNTSTVMSQEEISREQQSQFLPQNIFDQIHVALHS